MEVLTDIMWGALLTLAALCVIDLVGILLVGVTWLAVTYRRTSMVLSLLLIAVLVTAVIEGLLGTTLAMVFADVAATALIAFAILEWRHPETVHYETTAELN
jgi:hypothetical protein